MAIVFDEGSMKANILSRAVNVLWIAFVIVAAIYVATTDTGQRGVTTRVLLLASVGSSVLVVFSGIWARKALRKRLAELTTKESAQVAAFVLAGFACLALFAALAFSIN